MRIKLSSKFMNIFSSIFSKNSKQLILATLLFCLPISLSLSFGSKLGNALYHYTKINISSVPERIYPDRLRSLLFSCSPTSHIDESLLQAKIKQGLPKWARAQIQEDLKLFKDIKAKNLDIILQLNQNPQNNLVRFQIQNAHVTMSYFSMSDFPNTEVARDSYARAHIDPSIAKRAKPIFEILKFLAQQGYLKNTDFILSLSDYVTLSDTLSDTLPNNKYPIPIFTFAKDLSNGHEKHLILIPDWMNLCSSKNIRFRIQKASLLYPWNNKKALAFWRGGRGDSSGLRKKIVALSSLRPDLIDAKFHNYRLEAAVSEEDHLQYRYQISIDGVRASWERLVWQLHSNSLVFKNDSKQVQWFYKGILPDKHFISFNDEAELLQKLSWAELHPNETQNIIRNASSFAEQNLALEDMLHYMIILLNEYSKALQANPHNP